MPRKKVGKTPILLKLSGPASVRYGTLPKIPLPGDNELQKSFNIAAATALHGSGLYRRDILPVIPIENRLIEMSPAQFITWATDYFIPYKIKLDRQGLPFEVVHDMSQQHATVCLSDNAFILELPAIHRMHPAPVPLINDANSLVLATPGYDPSSGTYVFEGPLQPQPPDPSRPLITGPIDSGGYYDDSMTLGEAFWTLQDVHASFPFADWSEEAITPQPGDTLHAYDSVTGDHRSYNHSRSLAVHIGAMLSVFAAGCVPSVAQRMGFVYDANMRRSGKTLLAKIVVAAVHGMFKSQPWREEEESLIKILDSEIIAGSPYICFDNVRGLIESPALESLLTSPIWTGRHLGRSEMFTAENNMVLLITGNNVTLNPDLMERTLWVELFCEDADPQARIDPAFILDDVWLSNIDNRRRILSALWSIVRHWDYAGRPLASGKPRRGFETWGRIIGGMVEFAGFGDMLAHAKLENAGDTENDDINALVRHLWDNGAGAHRDFTYQEIVHTCWQEGLFPWNMQGKEETYPLRDGLPHIITLRLSDTCNSRMGLLLKRHTPERGSVHAFRPTPGAEIVRARFSAKGKGRHKRFYVTPA
jgi:hypothetical protein